jgi:hypothetical protein
MNSLTYTDTTKEITYVSMEEMLYTLDVNYCEILKLSSHGIEGNNNKIIKNILGYIKDITETTNMSTLVNSVMVRETEKNDLITELVRINLDNKYKFKNNNETTYHKMTIRELIHERIINSIDGFLNKVNISYEIHKNQEIQEIK